MLNLIVWNGIVFDIENLITLNLIVWNGTVFDIENLVTLNWIVLYKTFLKFNCV